MVLIDTGYWRALGNPKDKFHTGCCPISDASPAHIHRLRLVFCCRA